MSEEHLETLVKTMEISSTTAKKVGVAGDMDDFWDDCVESKNVNSTNKKQNHSNKKLNNNNPDDEDGPEDYITCKIN